MGMKLHTEVGREFLSDERPSRISGSTLHTRALFFAFVDLVRFATLLVCWLLEPIIIHHDHTPAG